MAEAEGPESTANVLRQAASDVSSVAPSVAIELYQRALSLMPAGDDRRLEVEVACLEPLARAGDIRAAKTRAGALLAEFAQPEQQRRIQTGLAAVLATAGDLTSSTMHYREAASTDSQTAAVAACLSTGQRVLLGDDAAEITRELDGYLATTEDQHVACAAHQGLALAAGACCEFDKAAYHALESFRRFDPGTMPRSGFLLPDVWMGSFDAFRDRFEEAAVLYERVGYEAERRQGLPTLVQTSAGLGLIALFNGRWNDAVREFNAVLMIAEETGANAHLVTAHAGLAGISLARGNTDEGHAQLAAGHDAMQAGLHLFGVDLLLWVTALDAVDRGDDAAAFELLWHLWQVTANMRGLTQFRSLAPDLVKTALATHHVDVAVQVVATVEQLAERSTLTSVVAASRRCRGLLDQSPVDLAEAATLLDQTPWRVDHARACEEAADLLGRTGSAEHAQQLARKAATEFAGIGATAAVDRVLRKHQTVAGEPDSSGGRPGTTWDALSPRELEVAELVITGMTNPEIAQQLYISRRTVESHVANAMHKLGVANRTQMASLAIGRSSRRTSDAR